MIYRCRHCEKWVRAWELEKKGADGEDAIEDGLCLACWNWKVTHLRPRPLAHGDLIADDRRALARELNARLL